MTQLVGRILRQPEVSKTGVEALDQCYVFTYHAQTGEVVNKVKKGLEEEGMAELASRIVDTTASSPPVVFRERRSEFKDRKYYLPQVLVYEGGDQARELDWEADILAPISWCDLHLLPPEGGLPKGDAEMVGGVKSIGIDIVKGGVAKTLEAGKSAAAFDRVFAVRALMDHTPNPWVAQQWVDEYVDSLLANGWTEIDLGERQQYVVREIVKRAAAVVDTAAKEVFEKGIEAGSIAFHLVAEKWWPRWEMPDKSSVAAGAKKIRREDDSDLERNLFDPCYQGELNGLELKVACFVDRQEAVAWWYKNLVRGSAYGLQGWRRNRIYPDFIIAQEANGEVERWLVIETKGDQLAGNLDTDYKRELLEQLSRTYANPGSKVGQLELFERKVKYECALVADSEWEHRLRDLV